MADAASPSEPEPAGIEQGAYEVIRDRLLGHGRELSRKAEALNAARVALFGGARLEVVGSERIRTENNCIARDIVAVGDLLVFGYNVFIGLRRETRLEDVFTLRRLSRDGDRLGLVEVPAGDPADFLADPRFRKDFRELYDYYKDTRLLSLRRVNGRLLAVFQVGRTLVDLKAFRWSIDADGTLTYLDNQGDRDHVFPATHDFEWIETTRDDHVSGEHPHVSILDEVFVETVGGDLTVKVEDNTLDGLGVYREPVLDGTQALDDASVHYAKLGSLILIKVLPFREETWRYLVFNTITKKVERIDQIGHACVQLPEDHGIIYPGGYYLRRGETRTFAADVQSMQFERAIRSPNGEDVLYIFHRQVEGEYVLLPYNLIRKEVETPIRGHGQSVFDDGKMIVFRSAGDEPTRVHAMQIWQTPFTSDVFHAAAPAGDSHLERLGNADLVRGISDALSIRRMTDEQTPSREMYEELIGVTSKVIDTYHWLGDAEVGDLLSTLQEVLAASELIIDEFEKVQELRAQARRAVAEADAGVRQLVATLRPDHWKSVDDFVGALAGLRTERGRLVSLREMRYADGERITALEETVVGHRDRVSERTVEFLQGAGALAPYHDRVAAVESSIQAVAKTADAKPLSENLTAIGDGLELLTDVVGSLKIDDATIRTGILERISEVMGGLNRTRALVAARRKELMSKEGVAEFAAQYALLSQSVSGAVALADTPERCDEQLSKLMLHVEELEGRFGELEDFVEQLTTKREEIYEALEGKKQRLLDQRQRRAIGMMRAVDRILSGVTRRAAGMQTLDELHAYFASDAMVLKVRDLAEQLSGLDDSVRADEVESRLKSTREDAVRAMRDRIDIFEDGATVIRLGKHRFSVNTQPLDLTLVPHDEGLAVHLSGTDFREAVRDEAFDATREYWEQAVVSETSDVYRGEYLAYCMLRAAERNEGGLSASRLAEAALDADALLALVREFSAERYDEGYERGVHDADATLVLKAVFGVYQTAGMLRFAPAARAAACLFWARFDDVDARDRLTRRASSLFRLSEALHRAGAVDALEEDLTNRIRTFHDVHGLPLTDGDARLAGRYLFEELGGDPGRFIASSESVALSDAFKKDLKRRKQLRALEQDLGALGGAVGEQYAVADAWLTAWLATRDDGAAIAHLVPEAVVLLLTAEQLRRDITSAAATVEIDGLLGQHGRISGRKMELRLDEYLARLARFAHERVPGFRTYQQMRHDLLERERNRLRIEEYLPRVMSAFVRNRLIDEVYLPVIGDNLAKQLGARGAAKRTDLMGLLMLISPPGYGKTTLMEYIANRLGLVFMKINGPALGHDVRSLDPDEAPNATARQEIDKVNLAFEMGNNVLLYIDDIQHTHSEFLQKFISLCDATRRVEGVWNGRTRTYDLRGKKFVVCMAGNPYTESGERFQVPDMLANRADVYNLGDVLSGKDELFAMSYIENALTSNAVLQTVANRGHKDIHPLVRMARGEQVQTSELSADFSQVELDEIVSVLGKVLRVQEVLLAVNREYIRSASTDDAFRTEPRFQLQGSYRNMNKLAEKIVAVMNDDELEVLIEDHYLGESQTLTSGAEHNLLKFAELRERMTDEQSARWTEIRDAFRRRQMMGGDEDDPVMRVTAQLMDISERMGGIGDALRTATTLTAEHETHVIEAQAARDDHQDREREALREALVAADSNGDAGAGLAQALAPYLTRLEDNLAALAESRAAESASPARAQSDAAAPAGADPDFKYLAARQAEVIEVGLLPVLRSLNHNLTVSKAVWERVGAISQALERFRRPRKKKPEDDA